MLYRVLLFGLLGIAIGFAPADAPTRVSGLVTDSLGTPAPNISLGFIECPVSPVQDQCDHTASVATSDSLGRFEFVLPNDTTGRFVAVNHGIIRPARLEGDRFSLPRDSSRFVRLTLLDCVVPKCSTYEEPPRRTPRW